MNLKNLVDSLATQYPTAPRSQILSIVRTTFEMMRHELDSTEEGVVSYSGLGRFRARAIEIEKDGAKRVEKRITFQAVVPKSLK